MKQHFKADNETELIICMLGNFSCFSCHLLTFFKINFYKKFFQEHCESVKKFRSRLGPNCLQRLSADDKSLLAFIVVCRLFHNYIFQKILSGTLSECRTVWIQIRTDIMSVLNWIQTVHKVYQQITNFATSKERVKLYLRRLAPIYFGNQNRNV